VESQRLGSDDAPQFSARFRRGRKQIAAGICRSIRSDPGSSTATASLDVPRVLLHARTLAVRRASDGRSPRCKCRSPFRERESADSATTHRLTAWLFASALWGVGRLGYPSWIITNATKLECCQPSSPARLAESIPL
jgi:hypothetical protein